MRWTLVIVGVLAVAAGGVMFLMNRGSAPEAAPDAGAAGEGTGETDPSGPGSFPQPSEDDLALGRLREEIARSEPVAFRSDEQRLAEARAWVEANRDPDRPYNEIEAKILALMDVFADGEERSAEWMMNMSQIEVEMVRAIDADGDGQVTDEEVQMFIDAGLGMMFNPMEHPYLQDKFDTDGDGVVSPDEMAAFATSLSDGALSGVFDRGKANSWDTDNNGFLSETERVAGEQAAEERFREMFGEAMDFSQITEEQRAEMTPAQIEAMDASREMLMNQAAAMDLMEAIRLDDLPQPDPAEMMKDMPQPPDAMSYDADGDGTLSDTERADVMLAMEDYQREVQDWGQILTAHRLRDQFEHATERHDLDLDGRLTDTEWEERITDLLIDREQRLFLINYDLDGSGRVDASELNTFMTWYGQSSIRADSNLDGTVDVRDLETMVTTFQRQGG